jgi:hypothetical protein
MAIINRPLWFAWGISMSGPKEIQPPRLLEEVRRVRLVDHYSMHTERSYIESVVRFVRFHGMRSREALFLASTKSSFAKVGLERQPGVGEPERAERKPRRRAGRSSWSSKSRNGMSAGRGEKREQRTAGPVGGIDELVGGLSVLCGHEDPFEGWGPIFG